MVQLFKFFMKVEKLKLELNKSLDNLFEEYFSDKSEEEKNEIKRKYDQKSSIQKH